MSPVLRCKDEAPRSSPQEIIAKATNPIPIEKRRGRWLLKAGIGCKRRKMAATFIFDSTKPYTVSDALFAEFLILRCSDVDRSTQTLQLTSLSRCAHPPDKAGP